MMTVNEVSQLTGVSVRTLQYYDTIGLLKPDEYTKSGYRLYDVASLERLQQILLFKELQFSLKEIGTILDSPDFDRESTLERQIELLTMKAERLNGIISFARKIKETGEMNMDFTAFDTAKLDEYEKLAKEKWGKTPEYAEYEAKTKGRTDDDEKVVMQSFMQIFAEFGRMKELAPSDGRVQLQVKKLQSFITEHYYKCSPEILAGLGKMYCAGGEFTDNIDRAGGAGTADFTAGAIEIFCG